MGLWGLSLKAGSAGVVAAGATPLADDAGLSVTVGAGEDAVGDPEGVGAAVDVAVDREVDVAQAVSNKLRQTTAAVVQRGLARRSSWPIWLEGGVSAFIKIRFSSGEVQQKSRHRRWPAGRVDAPWLPPPVGECAKKG
jgi:hypothetical protein